MTGAFDSGPEEEEDDEEDVSEEEEGGEKKTGEDAPDAMKEAAGVESIKKEHPADRPMKGLPRSSPAKSTPTTSTTSANPAATATFDAATVKREIEAAKARAAELVKGLSRPEAAVVAKKGEGKGLVSSVKSVVA